jgi:hypothetical protein
MRRLKWQWLPAAALVLGQATVANAAGSVPRYDHVFLIIEENHGYADIIGNPAAPNINRLATTYGSATQSFGVASPSEPNYVAMLGGNFFGIASDDPFYVNSVDKPSLMSQLDAAGLSWKGYFQGMPYPGYRNMCYPNRCNGVPDFDTLYASKHNGMMNFKGIRDNPASRARMVPIKQLWGDLLKSPPNFGYIVPDECTDMHGAPPYCTDSGNPGDPADNILVGVGDRLVGRIVDAITEAPFWKKGNNAIVITWDEGDDNAGCCDGNPGAGQIPTVVITSHGPRGLQDPTPYNHYSLLQTFQQAFGLGCLEFTCDTTNVTPMAPLFAVH